jgi:hypothetical protein
MEETLWRPRDDNIKIDLNERECENVRMWTGFIWAHDKQ